MPPDSLPSEPSPRPRALWIAAHPHRRTLGLCAAWDVPLRLVRPGRRGRMVWILRIVEALRLLRRERPDIVFVANPSLVLSLLVCLTRPLYGHFLVVDAHNEGVRPFDRPNALVRCLTRLLLRRADATLVSNHALGDDVIDAGGRPFVLPDRLPVPAASASPPTRPNGVPQVVVIATFRRDEPIPAILEAAARMTDVEFAFTGDASTLAKNGNGLSPNVRLAGYLEDHEYWRLLSGADVICDLTLKPDCLVCGAYESVALAKPMVLSDDAATRELFGSAAVLTRNEPGAIATALHTALEQRERLAAASRELREAYAARWGAQGAAIRNAIHSAAHAAQRVVRV